MRKCAFAAILTIIVSAVAQVGWAASGARITMLVDVGDKQYEGMPLAVSRDHLFLLARDGRLWDIAPQETSNYRKISSYFSSYSAAEMRAALERELGGRLEVTGTGHYLVAHPRGKAKHWAAKFEELYRSCVNYFARRDLKVNEPEFPLVAVVWPRREDFVRYAMLDGKSVRDEVLGFYSPKSNRVTLYDLGDGVSSDRIWRQNEATIIHEATHQMAFNIGVHNRFAPTPLWIAEGLGTMFEARGVWDWRSYPQLKDRVNRERLAQFRAWEANGRKPGSFATLLASDRAFESNPAAAYAESWAWVLFLTETYPQKFSQYVQKTSRCEDFQDYPLARRVSDFTSVFGDDLRMLEKHFLEFIRSL